MTHLTYKYKYSLSKHRHKYMYEFTSENPEVGCDLADEAAANYHFQHGGYEAVWPIELRLYNEHDKALGTFLIQREVEPVFVSEQI